MRYNHPPEQATVANPSEHECGCGRHVSEGSDGDPPGVYGD